VPTDSNTDNETQQTGFSRARITQFYENDIDMFVENCDALSRRSGEYAGHYM